MRLYIAIKSRVISIFQVIYFIFTGKSSKKSNALLYLKDKIVNEAKDQAKNEASKIISEARVQIDHMKME